MTDIVILDTAAAQPDPPLRLVRDGKPRYAHGADGRVIERRPLAVDTICVHQTACVFGPLGDETRRHDRAHDIPIHAVAFRDGVLAIPYPASWYLYHGNGWNARSLGIEIEGMYEGIESDGESRPDLRGLDDVHAHDTILDDLTIATARRGISELVTVGRALGMPISRIVTHRQSADDRRADPGQAIYRHVILDYAVAVLGLTPVVGAIDRNHGRPVPIEWFPGSGVGHY